MGIPVEIEYNGKSQINSVGGRNKLDQLQSHPGTIVGNAESLVHLDLSSYLTSDVMVVDSDERKTSKNV